MVSWLNRWSLKKLKLVVNGQLIEWLMVWIVDCELIKPMVDKKVGVIDCDELIWWMVGDESRGFDSDLIIGSMVVCKKVRVVDVRKLELIIVLSWLDQWSVRKLEFLMVSCWYWINGRWESCLWWFFNTITTKIVEKIKHSSINSK